jgi:hypothetical protein
MLSLRWTLSEGASIMGKRQKARRPNKESSQYDPVLYSRENTVEHGDGPPRLQVEQTIECLAKNCRLLRQSYPCQQPAALPYSLGIGARSC